jgi:hypothetical protein
LFSFKLKYYYCVGFLRSDVLDGAYITQNQYDTFASFHSQLQKFYSLCTTYPYIISQMNVPTLNDNPVQFKQPQLASLSPQQAAEMHRLAMETQQRQAMETQRQQVDWTRGSGFGVLVVLVVVVFLLFDFISFIVIILDIYFMSSAMADFLTLQAMAHQQAQQHAQQQAILQQQQEAQRQAMLQKEEEDRVRRALVKEQKRQLKLQTQALRQQQVQCLL